VTFGDAHVEETLGIFLLERTGAGAGGHGSSNCYQLWMLTGKRCETFAEHLSPGWRTT
jgi:hypothetical protein